MRKALVAAAALIGALAACGTLLETNSEEGIPMRSDAEAEASAPDGGTEGGPQQVGDLVLTVDTPTVELRAGGAAQPLTITSRHTTGSASTAALVPQLPSNITANPGGTVIGDGTVTFMLEADAQRRPARLGGGILAVVGSTMQTLSFTILVSAEFREPAVPATFTVEKDQIYFVKAWGAGGGGLVGGPPGGAGGYAEGTIAVPAKTMLFVVAGSAGQQPGAAGFPGGGPGGPSDAMARYGYGGGGYSGVFFNNNGSQSAVRVLAGGGGGASISNAGGGGGLPGQPGFGPMGGGGGTSSIGGTNGDGSNGPPNAGSPLNGGIGASNTSSAGIEGGGGGGGGYFGGGGGQKSGASGASGGGGGASFAPDGGTTMNADAAAPGNPGDSDRGDAGTPGRPGVVFMFAK